MKFLFDEIGLDQKEDLVDVLASWKARRILLEGHKSVVEKRLEEAVKMEDALDLLTGDPFNRNAAENRNRDLLSKVGAAVKDYGVPEDREVFAGNPYAYLRLQMRQEYPVTEEEIAEHAAEVVDLLVVGSVHDVIAFRLKAEFGGDVDAFLDRYAPEFGLVKASEVGADV